ncbi:DnaD domain protein [Metallumcola ferriviriculae]|uniref:DnaD domain protein n=1 Tax=Metallumcola ferriviriculae TaxID=3039180 RepID=A0AAU0UNX4_9FIRM|nr:DnaD domain protein [Desulfitibacteraceae bacterium MK1]
MESTSPLSLLMEQGATFVPNILIENYTRLGLDERDVMVIIQLLRFRQSQNQRRPLLKVLTQCSTIAESEMKEILSHLEEKGIIRLMSIQDDQGRWSKVYMLDGLYERLQSLFNRKEDNVGREEEFDRLAKLFSQVVGLPVAPKHERMIIQWLYEYEFALELVEYVLIECCERSGVWQKDWRIKAVMESLYNAGFKSVSEVRDWFLTYDQDYYWINKFAQVLGRPIKSNPEKSALRRWSSEWGFSDEMIALALEKGCLAASQPSFNYIETILKSWREKGISDPEHVNSEEEAHQAKKSKRRDKQADKLSVKRNIPKIDPETGMVIT